MSLDFNTLCTKKDDFLEKFLKDPFRVKPTLDEAILISRKYGVGLHPSNLYYFDELSASEFIEFLEFLSKNMKFEKDGSSSCSSEKKREFEIIGIEHTLAKKDIKHNEKEINSIVIDSLNTSKILVNLGLIDYKKVTLSSFQKRIVELVAYISEYLSKTPQILLNECNELSIRDKAGTYIGARMGRPEKAKMRKQFNSETKSHALFPVGTAGGRTKNLVDVFKKEGAVEEHFRVYIDADNGEETIYPMSLDTKTPNKQKVFEKYTFRELKEETDESILFKKTTIDLNPYEKELRNILGPNVPYPKHVKGITDTINQHHTVEHLAKGFLRAINGVYVNKDGSIRFDMIEMGMTHFKPKEIGTSIEKLHKLGYTHDYLGKVLENKEQICEMLPQDVALPDCAESGDEFASDFVMKTGNYVDDLLEKLYKLPKFYNFKTKEDTIGHLLIGLAPHTSAGIVGRIIGYTNTQGCFSHPVWHAAQRRNLDGDENGVMLLLDGLINSSREFLPNRRGSRTMDVSLVLTAHLLLDQVDDEVHGMDIVSHYPLDFYRKNKTYCSPKDVKIEQVEKRVYTEEIGDRYLGYQFTHDTDNMNDTIMCSSYKSVPSMKEKLDLQLALGRKIRAVDADKVGALVIDKHFMKDIKGNLRKFGQQQFRCTNCNTKYRRPPLIGKCVNCKEPSVNFTISEGSVKKYVQHSFDICRDFNIDPYLVEVLELTQLRLDGVFGKDLEKQKSLSSFFGKK
jgi:DNA polymerase II large subunit